MKTLKQNRARLFLAILLTFSGASLSLAVDNPTHVINGSRYAANETHEGILKFESENGQNVPYLEVTENGRTRKFELVVNRNNLDFMEKIKALPKDEPYVFFGALSGGHILVSTYRPGRLSAEARAEQLNALRPGTIAGLLPEPLAGLLVGDHLFRWTSSDDTVVVYQCKENGVLKATLQQCKRLYKFEGQLIEKILTRHLLEEKEFTKENAVKPFPELLSTLREHDLAQKSTLRRLTEALENPALSEAKKRSIQEAQVHSETELTSTQARLKKAEKAHTEWKWLKERMSPELGIPFPDTTSLAKYLHSEFSIGKHAIAEFDFSRDFIFLDSGFQDGPVRQALWEKVMGKSSVKSHDERDPSEPVYCGHSGTKDNNFAYLQLPEFFARLNRLRRSQGDTCIYRPPLNEEWKEECERHMRKMKNWQERKSILGEGHLSEQPDLNLFPGSRGLQLTIPGNAEAYRSFETISAMSKELYYPNNYYNRGNYNNESNVCHTSRSGVYNSDAFAVRLFRDCSMRGATTTTE